MHDARIVPRGPADTAFDQVVKSGIAPSSLIMSPGGVENPPLTVSPNPRPRLLRRALDAVFEDGATLIVVLGVDIGFVPALEALEPSHDGVIRSSDNRAERTRAVALELGTDQL